MAIPNNDALHIADCLDAARAIQLAPMLKTVLARNPPVEHYWEQPTGTPIHDPGDAGDGG